MRSIKPQNQIWCATHSAELIDEAGRERTFYLRMAEDRQEAECIPAVDEGSEIQALRDLFGYAGYVGIAKKIVFVEGCDSSADRRTFANVLPQLSREVKLIPVGTGDNLYRVNRAVLALLESEFARCEFFLIRDRDYLSQDAIAKYQALALGRLFVLSRYHIENYLLDEVLISAVLEETYSITLTPSEVRDQLFRIARDNSAGFLRDMVAFRFGELFQSEDCSIGSHSQGLNLFSDNMEMRADVFGPLKEQLIDKVAQIQSEVAKRIGDAQQRAILDECVECVRECLCVENDLWKVTFPGRYVLQRFSGKHRLGKWPALQNVLISRIVQGGFALEQELDGIFRQILRA